MKTSISSLSSSSALALLSLLLGGIVGCATETGGGGSGTGASAGTSSGAPSSPCVTTLASSKFGWGPLALQGERVSWATLNSGATIMSVPVGGGAPTALAPNDGLVFAMAADATHVYWAQGDGVMRVAASGGPATQLAPLTSSERVSQIAVDADSVYWLQFPLAVSDPNATSVPGSLRKAPLAGGAATEIASFGVTNITGYFTVDDASVYWSDAVMGTIMKAPKGGGPPVTLATGQDQPQSLVVDADSVYWVSWSMGAQKPPWLAKVATTGGAPVTLASSSDGEGFDQIAVDATGVYWFGGSSGGTRVLHTSLAGGPMEVLADQSDTAGVALIACPGGVCWVWSTPDIFPSNDPEKGNVLRWQACQ